MKYNWQMTEWPEFVYDTAEIEPKLVRIVDHAGQLQGAFQGMKQQDQDAACVDIMVAEAIKTSEIEGESLNRPDVASSIRNRLGLLPADGHIRSQAARGVGELMVAVRESWNDMLTDEVLFSWHELLMMGRSDIMEGKWRDHDEPMRVVSSGPVGEQTILFEAPPSCRVPGEMSSFLKWFNASRDNGIRGPIRAAIAHLYFESIHPFEDGNGRIGRAIAEKAISQGLGRPALINLSQAIDQNRRRYYQALGEAQRSLKVTEWVTYFVDIVLTALSLAGEQIDFVVQKARLLDRISGQLNERQQKIVLRMLKEGPPGFKGGMTARKYVAMTGASKATATRDLRDLVEKRVLRVTGGGRSSSYSLVL